LTRLEVVRRLLSRRSLPVYLLVSLPIMLGLLRALVLPEHLRGNMAHTTTDFAETFQYFLLRFIVFFGCAGLFINLFRGEMLDRSLHYSLLAPVRRDVLVVGKYLGGLVTSVAVFSAMTVATYVLFFVPHGLGRAGQYLVSGTGIGHLLTYIVVASLACVGYGAVFLLAGLLFRNPMVPAVLFLGWEFLVPFLPPALKIVSVAHHVTSLTPVPVALGPLAMAADPAPAWLAVTGLVGVSAVLLGLAALKARQLEITYATE